ncbi:MAG: type II 3-dehydroquinate dehydratase [Actinobacteria bacterium]|nr:type II 3-dehydroquinate dehydratase [Actinomycetota bacterium]
MKKILLINGPNLNLLGQREEEIYGTVSFDEILADLKQTAAKSGAEIEYFQSNHEGEIIDRMHQGIGNIDYIIFNPGALTHYSYSIRDAIKAIKIPLVEVHISNIYGREKWRSKSVISPVAAGTISGFGAYSYSMAIDFILKQQ